MSGELVKRMQWIQADWEAGEAVESTRAQRPDWLAAHDAEQQAIGAERALREAAEAMKDTSDDFTPNERWRFSNWLSGRAERRRAATVRAEADS